MKIVAVDVSISLIEQSNHSSRKSIVMRFRSQYIFLVFKKSKSMNHLCSHMLH